MMRGVANWQGGSVLVELTYTGILSFAREKYKLQGAVLQPNLNSLQTESHDGIGPRTTEMAEHNGWSLQP